MMDYYLFTISCTVLVLCPNACSQRYKTVYQKIQQEPSFTGFRDLIRNNRVAKLNLHYEQLTVFVPVNEAFRNLDEDINSDVAFYHMSFEIKTLAILNRTNSIETVVLENPPLWVTRAGNEIYVNNAKIILENSNYIARSRDGNMGKQQVLHMIDEMLNPMISSPRFTPNAYDFLSSPSNWNMGASKTVSNFFTKVQETKLQQVFKQNAGYTYFVPLDTGIDAHKFNIMNKHTILGHVIPFYVLFTRPTPKNFAYESLANDDYAYIVLSFEEKNEKLYVKGMTRGSYGAGEFLSEIVVPNIPIKNGVIHVISQPLGIFSRKLKPFPYLPVSDKIASDPSLDVFYEMGTKTGFNNIFSGKNVSFTYFVPDDSAWIKSKKYGLEPIERDIDILGRHLIISQVPYSIEQLYSLTKARNYTDIELQTESGPLRIMVVRIEGDYYLKWYNRYIKILRPNYECSDGIVHVIASPLTNFRKTSEGRIDREAMNPINYENIWKLVQGVWKKVI
ncbi:fasciclin-1 isoform X1 [Leptinotarsa decemlineata]|uniref:fasciclin-1 isoform X1 n=1 Tax=Leptinotarsa decemlineata TaxID=7539 RepID=UPI003D3060C2